MVVVMLKYHSEVLVFWILKMMIKIGFVGVF